jgi:hypothetical protein
MVFEAGMKNPTSGTLLSLNQPGCLLAKMWDFERRSTLLIAPIFTNIFELKD